MHVTDETSVREAFHTVEEIVEEGCLVAMINNAGMVIYGSVLHIPIEEWRKQFEINLFAAICVTQVFFPLLIKDQAKDPHPRRIINMSSISGLFSSPFLSPYVASKFALEAMSDCLRRELFIYDVQVVLLEPGNIRTPIWTKARTTSSYFGPEYESLLSFKDKIIDRNIESALDVRAMDRSILNAVSGKSVKLRYLVKKDKWKFNLVRLLPARWVDYMIKKALRSKSGIRPF